MKLGEAYPPLLRGYRSPNGWLCLRGLVSSSASISIPIWILLEAWEKESIIFEVECIFFCMSILSGAIL